jgi:hypothetical protein
VDIIPYIDITDNQKKSIVDILQCFYITSENAIFMFNLENLDTYFSGHNTDSYISFYNKKEYNIQNNEITMKEKPLGIITSRSGELIINNTINPIYYIDFICIHRNESKNKKIPRLLLQTHIYKQQFICPEIMASLFKKEGELYSGIIPFIKFQSIIYEIPYQLEKIAVKLPEHIILIEINESNIHVLFDFLELSKQVFIVFGITDLINLKKLITSQILFVYCLQKKNEIYEAYFFRDTRTNYEQGLTGCLLQLCGSIHNTTSIDLFLKGFFFSLKNIIKKIPVFKLLMIDIISHNHIFYDNITFNKIMDNTSAYYLYNMIYPNSPILENKAFILF